MYYKHTFYTFLVSGDYCVVVLYGDEQLVKMCFNILRGTDFFGNIIPFPGINLYMYIFFSKFKMNVLLIL